MGEEKNFQFFSSPISKIDVKKGFPLIKNSRWLICWRYHTSNEYFLQDYLAPHTRRFITLWKPASTILRPAWLLNQLSN